MPDPRRKLSFPDPPSHKLPEVSDRKITGKPKTHVKNITGLSPQKTLDSEETKPFDEVKPTQDSPKYGEPGEVITVSDKPNSPASVNPTQQPSSLTISPRPEQLDFSESESDDNSSKELLDPRRKLSFPDPSPHKLPEVSDKPKTTVENITGLSPQKTLDYEDTKPFDVVKPTQDSPKDGEPGEVITVSDKPKSPASVKPTEQPKSLTICPKPEQLEISDSESDDDSSNDMHDPKRKLSLPDPSSHKLPEVSDRKLSDKQKTPVENITGLSPQMTLDTEETKPFDAVKPIKDSPKDGEPRGVLKFTNELKSPASLKPTKQPSSLTISTKPGQSEISEGESDDDSSKEMPDRRRKLSYPDPSSYQLPEVSDRKISDKPKTPVEYSTGLSPQETLDSEETKPFDEVKTTDASLKDGESVGGLKITDKPKSPTGVKPTEQPSSLTISPKPEQSEIYESESDDDGSKKLPDPRRKLSYPDPSSHKLREVCDRKISDKTKTPVEHSTGLSPQKTLDSEKTKPIDEGNPTQGSTKVGESVEMLQTTDKPKSPASVKPTEQPSSFTIHPKPEQSEIAESESDDDSSMEMPDPRRKLSFPDPSSYQLPEVSDRKISDKPKTPIEFSTGLSPQETLDSEETKPFDEVEPTHGSPKDGDSVGGLKTTDKPKSPTGVKPTEQPSSLTISPKPEQSENSESKSDDDGSKKLPDPRRKLSFPDPSSYQLPEVSDRKLSDKPKTPVEYMTGLSPQNTLCSEETKPFDSVKPTQDSPKDGEPRRVLKTTDKPKSPAGVKPTEQLSSFTISPKPEQSEISESESDYDSSNEMLDQKRKPTEQSSSFTISPKPEQSEITGSESDDDSSNEMLDQKRKLSLPDNSSHKLPEVSDKKISDKPKTAVEYGTGLSPHETLDSEETKPFDEVEPTDGSPKDGDSVGGLKITDKPKSPIGVKPTEQLSSFTIAPKPEQSEISERESDDDGSKKLPDPRRKLSFPDPSSHKLPEVSDRKLSDKPKTPIEDTTGMSSLKTLDFDATKPLDEVKPTYGSPRDGVSVEGIKTTDKPKSPASVKPTEQPKSLTISPKPEQLEISDSESDDDSRKEMPDPRRKLSFPDPSFHKLPEVSDRKLTEKLKTPVENITGLSPQKTLDSEETKPIDEVKPSKDSPKVGEPGEVLETTHKPKSPAGVKPTEQLSSFTIAPKPEKSEISEGESDTDSSNDMLDSKRKLSLPDPSSHKLPEVSDRKLTDKQKTPVENITGLSPQTTLDSEETKPFDAVKPIKDSPKVGEPGEVFQTTDKPKSPAGVKPTEQLSSFTIAPKPEQSEISEGESDDDSSKEMTDPRSKLSFPDPSSHKLPEVSDRKLSDKQKTPVENITGLSPQTTLDSEETKPFDEVKPTKDSPKVGEPGEVLQSTDKPKSPASVKPTEQPKSLTICPKPEQLEISDSESDDDSRKEMPDPKRKLSFPEPSFHKLPEVCDRKLTETPVENITGLSPQKTLDSEETKPFDEVRLIQKSPKDGEPGEMLQTTEKPKSPGSVKPTEQPGSLTIAPKPTQSEISESKSVDDSCKEMPDPKRKLSFPDPSSHKLPEVSDGKFSDKPKTPIENVTGISPLKTLDSEETKPCDAGKPTQGSLKDGEPRVALKTTDKSIPPASVKPTKQLSSLAISPKSEQSEISESKPDDDSSKEMPDPRRKLSFLDPSSQQLPEVSDRNISDKPKTPVEYSTGLSPKKTLDSEETNPFEEVKPTQDSHKIGEPGEVLQTTDKLQSPASVNPTEQPSSLLISPNIEHSEISESESDDDIIKDMPDPKRKLPLRVSSSHKLPEVSDRKISDKPKTPVEYITGLSPLKTLDSEETKPCDAVKPTQESPKDGEPREVLKSTDKPKSPASLKPTEQPSSLTIAPKPEQSEISEGESDTDSSKKMPDPRRKLSFPDPSAHKLLAISDRKLSDNPKTPVKNIAELSPQKTLDSEETKPFEEVKPTQDSPKVGEPGEVLQTTDKLKYPASVKPTEQPSSLTIVPEPEQSDISESKSDDDSRKELADPRRKVFFPDPFSRKLPEVFDGKLSDKPKSPVGYSTGISPQKTLDSEETKPCDAVKPTQESPKDGEPREVLKSTDKQIPPPSVKSTEQPSSFNISPKPEQSEISESESDDDGSMQISDSGSKLFFPDPSSSKLPEVSDRKLTDKPKTPVENIAELSPQKTLDSEETKTFDEVKPTQDSPKVCEPGEALKTTEKPKSPVSVKPSEQTSSFSISLTPEQSEISDGESDDDSSKEMGDSRRKLSFPDPSFRKLLEVSDRKLSDKPETPVQKTLDSKETKPFDEVRHTDGSLEDCESVKGLKTTDKSKSLASVKPTEQPSSLSIPPKPEQSEISEGESDDDSSKEMPDPKIELSFPDPSSRKLLEVSDGKHSDKPNTPFENITGIFPLKTLDSEEIKPCDAVKPTQESPKVGEPGEVLQTTDKPIPPASVKVTEQPSSLAIFPKSEPSEISESKLDDYSSKEMPDLRRKLSFPDPSSHKLPANSDRNLSDNPKTLVENITELSPQTTLDSEETNPFEEVKPTQDSPKVGEPGEVLKTTDKPKSPASVKNTEQPSSLTIAPKPEQSEISEGESDDDSSKEMPDPRRKLSFPDPSSRKLPEVCDGKLSGKPKTPVENITGISPLKTLDSIDIKPCDAVKPTQESPKDGEPREVLKTTDKPIPPASVKPMEQTSSLAISPKPEQSEISESESDDDGSMEISDSGSKLCFPDPSSSKLPEVSDRKLTDKPKTPVENIAELSPQKTLYSEETKPFDEVKHTDGSPEDCESVKGLKTTDKTKSLASVKPTEQPSSLSIPPKPEQSEISESESDDDSSKEMPDPKRELSFPDPSSRKLPEVSDGKLSDKPSTPFENITGISPLKTLDSEETKPFDEVKTTDASLRDCESVEMLKTTDKPIPPASVKPTEQPSSLTISPKPEQSEVFERESVDDGCMEMPNPRSTMSLRDPFSHKLPEVSERKLSDKPKIPVENIIGLSLQKTLDSEETKPTHGSPKDGEPGDVLQTTDKPKSPTSVKLREEPSSLTISPRPEESKFCESESPFSKPSSVKSAEVADMKHTKKPDSYIEMKAELSAQMPIEPKNRHEKPTADLKSKPFSLEQTHALDFKQPDKSTTTDRGGDSRGVAYFVNFTENDTLKSQRQSKVSLSSRMTKKTTALDRETSNTHSVRNSSLNRSKVSTNKAAGSEKPKDKRPSKTPVKDKLNQDMKTKTGRGTKSSTTQERVITDTTRISALNNQIRLERTLSPLPKQTFSESIDSNSRSATPRSRIRTDITRVPQNQTLRSFSPPPNHAKTNYSSITSVYAYNRRTQTSSTRIKKTTENIISSRSSTPNDDSQRRRLRTPVQSSAMHHYMQPTIAHSRRYESLNRAESNISLDDKSSTRSPSATHSSRVTSHIKTRSERLYYQSSRHSSSKESVQSSISKTREEKSAPEKKRLAITSKQKVTMKNSKGTDKLKHETKSTKAFSPSVIYSKDASQNTVSLERKSLFSKQKSKSIPDSNRLKEIESSTPRKMAKSAASKVPVRLSTQKSSLADDNKKKKTVTRPEQRQTPGLKPKGGGAEHTEKASGAVDVKVQKKIKNTVNQASTTKSTFNASFSRSIQVRKTAATVTATTRRDTQSANKSEKDLLNIRLTEKKSTVHAATTKVSTVRLHREPIATTLVSTVIVNDDNDSESNARSMRSNESTKSSSSSAGSRKVLTSEVFTKTCGPDKPFEVIYRQPDVDYMSIMRPQSVEQRCVYEHDVSFIDTTDSSLSDSVALPIFTSDQDRLCMASPGSPKPTRSPFALIEETLRKQQAGGFALDPTLQRQFEAVDMLTSASGSPLPTTADEPTKKETIQEYIPEPQIVSIESVTRQGTITYDTINDKYRKEREDKDHGSDNDDDDDGDHSVGDDDDEDEDEDDRNGSVIDKDSNVVKGIQKTTQLENVRREATVLVDRVLEESIYIVNEQEDRNDSDPRNGDSKETGNVSSVQLGLATSSINDGNYRQEYNSESENYAITCDIVGGVDVVKSPTIESMSGKSFDDNLSSSDDQQQQQSIGPQEPPSRSGDDIRGAKITVQTSQTKETGGGFLKSTEITPVPQPPSAPVTATTEPTESTPIETPSTTMTFKADAEAAPKPKPRCVKAPSPDIERAEQDEREVNKAIDDLVSVPVPKPRSQMKPSDSYRNLVALDEACPPAKALQELHQTDSVNECIEESSHTEETSVDISVRSQNIDNATTATTTGATTTSDDPQTESLDPPSELPIDGGNAVIGGGERKTSFYIGESSNNIIVKTTPTKLSVGDDDEDDNDNCIDDSEGPLPHKISELIAATDISLMKEFSVDSEEDNDVFKEYVTIKPTEEQGGTRIRRQSSETRNDLLEEDVVAKEAVEEGIKEFEEDNAKETKGSPAQNATMDSNGGMDQVDIISAGTSVSLENAKATEKNKFELEEVAVKRPTELDISLEKSEWETTEKEIPPTGKSILKYSPQQQAPIALTKEEVTQELVTKTLDEVQESLEAAKNELKSVLNDGNSIKESPSEFEFRSFSQTLSSSAASNVLERDLKTGKIVEECIELVEAHDISSFIGIPEALQPQLNPIEGLFDSSVPESLDRAAAMIHYAHHELENVKSDIDRDDRASLGFISTGTDECPEENAPKQEQASLGFVSNETVEEFSSMEDYFQETLAKADTMRNKVEADKETAAQEIVSFPEISSECTIKPFDDVIHRVKPNTSDVATNRWSVPEIDQSSSSESYYKSLEKSESRPLSTDVDNLTTQGTSEYKTAAEGSSTYRETTEYMSAASTLDSLSGKTISSHDSMRSFDSHSETSANLISMDSSELTETLVASSTDDVDDHLRDLLDEDDSEESLDLEAADYAVTESKTNQQSMMKRSQEMIFKPKSEDTMTGVSNNEERSKEGRIESIQIEEYAKPKEAERTWGLTYPMEDAKSEDIKETDDILLYHGDVRRSIDESKYASSLDDGSVLSVSMSSASNIDTVVENFEDIAGSFGASSLAGIEGFGASSLPEETTFVLDMDGSRDQSPQETSSMSPADELNLKRGHKRTESTDVSTNEEKKLPEKEGVAVVGEGKESGSESDTDPYETEYARQFRSPTDRKSKKKKQAAAEMDHSFETEKRPFTPSQLVAEVIVEDVATEELEAEAAMVEDRRPSQNMLDYSNIPDITVTEDVQQKSPILEEETDTFEEKILYKVKTQEELHKVTDDKPIYQEPKSDAKEDSFQKLVQEQYKQKLAELKQAEIGDSDYDEHKAPDSPDSFEMVDQPDISDDFVIIEEVAKEANEDDLGGKSIRIQPTKYESKHDEEVEKMIIKSAPADPMLGSQIFRDDLNFEFEESPPTASSGGTGSETHEESDSGSDLAATNKRWVEMQLTDNQLRYPYELTGGVLEDIKEEDGEFEVGSSRISSFKDSFSSTPEYDAMAARRYYNRGEHDDVSMSSLQEFESLEQAISLENRNRTHQGSTDSSNGSFQRRYLVRHSGSGAGPGDDISVSSLKEFEGLENACIEAHLIEIKAKEEAALLSRSDESNKSNGSDREPSADSSNVVVSKVTRTVTHTEVLTGSQSPDIETLLKQKLQECERVQTASRIPHVLDAQFKTDSDKGSIDSLEMNKSLDLASSSADESFDISKDATKSDIDSLEVDKPHTTREDSFESTDMQQMDDLISKFGVTIGDGLTTTTTTTTTSTDADGQEHTTVTKRVVTTTTLTASGPSSTSLDLQLPQALPKDISADSLNQISIMDHTTTSSAGTTATYQTSAGNSQMSGSVTSCASSTLMEDSTTSITTSGLTTIHYSPEQHISVHKEADAITPKTDELKR
ncbi:uncharacterized protein LOC106087778 isoform X2 [Stomoxys calcitrans]|uniref:uncharacterized protein LOC106087778 isoform X2 n=1 Tax=Stomoxys calcitrans TaxID=35570 RepID=UPI0027E37266|nr:uncharacterized protein LOC106087778 isoform X2 [Stomoxys calcitrans]